MSTALNTGENERKREQAHRQSAPTLLDNAGHNEWQCHALEMLCAKFGWKWPCGFEKEDF